MKRKICQQGTLKYKANLTFELRTGVLCLFSSVHGLLNPIAIQSNHLLGNPPYTLTKRLLGNLTDLRFAFGFCLAFKSGFESVYINFSPKHRSNSTTLLPGLNSRQFPAVVSHTKSDHGALRMKDYYGISQKFLQQRMFWAANFKKIIRV